MKPNVEDILAVELKREIAERYFGFRKMIEEDTLDLMEKVKYQLSILEKRISYELIRIYILLKDEKLIHQFMELTGWEEKLFYDPYLTESPTIMKRVFTGVKIRGLTRAGRFKNIAFDAYERLVAHVEHYRQNLEEIESSRETITAEIELFYRKNDIGNIMGFLRAMEGVGNIDSMGVTPDTGAVNTFEHKMRIETPPPIDPKLISIPPLAAVPTISKQLKKLVDKAYKLHGAKFLAAIAK
jgi:alpha-galactosidase/6-phospho-beta-glucosidase family protein